MNGWKGLHWNRAITKDKVPNCPGIYIFYNSQGKPIYTGHSKIMRHRLQSYHEVDDFHAHPTKRNMRNHIAAVSYKKMPISKAKQMEKVIKHKMRFNFK
jgi:excinuclease UvrABC nuclease subunit